MPVPTAAKQTPAAIRDRRDCVLAPPRWARINALIPGTLPHEEQEFLVFDIRRFLDMDVQAMGGNEVESAESGFASILGRDCHF